MRRIFLLVLVVSTLFGCVVFGEMKPLNLATLADEITLTATHLDGITNGAKGTTVVGRLIDGDKEKGSYLTDYETRYGTLTFSFSSAIAFNHIMIYDVMRNTKTITISCSNDKVNWLKIYSFDRFIRNWGEQDIPCFFPVQTAKYIKIEIHDLYTMNESSSFGLCMAEIEIFNADPVAFDQMDQMIEEAESFLKETSGSEKPYFQERLEALQSEIETAKALKLKTDSTQEEVDSTFWSVREKLHLARDFLNYPAREYEKFIDHKKSELTFENQTFNEAELAKLKKTFDEAETLWQSMNKDGTSLIWSNIGTVESAIESMDHTKINTILANLKTLAIAATHSQSRLKGNSQLILDLAYAMNIFTTYWFGPDIPWFGYNYHGHIIGFIQKYGDILVLMYDEIDYDILRDNARKIKTQLRPDYTKFSGTNRHDIASGAAKIGAVLREDYFIQNYIEGISEDMVIQDGPFNGDGYYVDGSSIFHTSVPYSGTYNLDACEHIVEAVKLTAQTPWAPKDEALKSFLKDFIKEAYFPLMKNGSLMSMVLGRSIVQTTNVEKSAGHAAGLLIYQVANYLGEPHKTEFLSFLKQNFKNKTNNYFESFGPNLRSMMEDESILASQPLVLNKMYRYMDRAVHHRGNWAFGLAMSSSRISRYENTQNANKKGWFTGSGMTYFYDEDDTQYSNNYFLAADMKRMPGVTAVNTDMPSVTGSGTLQNTTKDFAGGVSLENLYGVAAFEPEQGDVNFSGRKSYYMFDDEVVMVGSGISSTLSNADTETTIDQRQVLKDENNLFINGTSLNATEVEMNIDNVKTVFLQGRNENSRFGYYFPSPVWLSVKKGTNTHKISESYQDLDTEITGNYASFYLNHGKSPSNEKYSYVVLPGKTKEETELYNQNPDIEILADQPSYHCVKEKSLNVIGLTNFENQRVSVGGLTVDKASISMVQVGENEISFSLTEPTMILSQPIRVEFEKSAAAILEKSPQITVLSLSPTIKLAVDPTNSYGETLSIKLKINNESYFENEPKVFIPQNYNNSFTIKAKNGQGSEEEFFINTPFGTVLTFVPEIAGSSLIEYGILFSKTNQSPEFFDTDCLKLQSKSDKRMDMKFGILFWGKGIHKNQTYYLRTYGVYERDGVLHYVYDSPTAITTAE